MKQIALLRGINVGGHRKMLMKDLKSLFESCGCTDVQTYIQSGNVLFKDNTERDRTALVSEIEQAITKTWNYDVPVILTLSEALRLAILNNPFRTSTEMDTSQLHFTFLRDTPTEEYHKKLTENLAQTATTDQCELIGNIVYLRCEKKYHQSKLTNQFFEAVLHTKATTRNWRTVVKLLELEKEV